MLIESAKLPSRHAKYRESTNTHRFIHFSEEHQYIYIAMGIYISITGVKKITHVQCGGVVKSIPIISKRQKSHYAPRSKCAPLINICTHTPKKKLGHSLSHIHEFYTRTILYVWHDYTRTILVFLPALVETVL